MVVEVVQVVHLAVAHVTSVVVQTVVVHVVAQEMVHAQVEDQQVSLPVSHQVDLLAIAKEFLKEKSPSQPGWGISL
jgi:hypothetical protein